MIGPLAALGLAGAAALIGSAVFDEREHTVVRWIAAFATIVVLVIMTAIVVSF